LQGALTLKLEGGLRNRTSEQAHIQVLRVLLRIRYLFIAEYNSY
jgi:hypothetical protein